MGFVITRGAKLWAVEVKSGRGGKTSGLESFRARYQDARILVVGDQGIPFQEFFGTPVEVWLRGGGFS